jgi:hypothetical protein
LDDVDRVTMRLRRYRKGATRRSRVSPSVARLRGSTICHISAWTWWRKTIFGPRAHTGEKNGMPFQISTRPSRGPARPESSNSAARGKIM